MQMFCACDHPGKGTATYTPSRSKSNAKIGNSVTEIRNFEELTKSAEDREKWKRYLKVANLHL